MLRKLISHENGTAIYGMDMEGSLFLHIEVKKWSRYLYQEYVDMFIDLCEELKKRNINRVFAVCPLHNSKAERFTEMFGFIEVGQTDNRRIMGRKLYGN
jgi:RimJ/RimL family protein N-acetyltransferase